MTENRDQREGQAAFVVVSGGGRPNLMYSPGLWSLILGPFGPDLGPDLDLSLTI